MVNKMFPVTGPGELKPGNFNRVAMLLSDDELEEEIMGRRGPAEYQLALLAEAERRAKGVPNGG